MPAYVRKMEAKRRIMTTLETAQAVVRQSLSTETNPPVSAASKRLLSLDALRGFNMFWIIGGAELISEIGKRIPNRAVSLITANLTQHVEWEGFHFHDLIFPMFLFIIGVAIPFSTAKRLEKGDTKRQILLHALRRTVILFLLGWMYYGFLEFKGFDHQRIMGVLQRLALGYGFAALVYLYTNTRKQVLIAGALLIGYWLMMRWIPVPGHPLGSMTPEGNLANYVDRMVFKPGQLYTSYGDPEGLLSTIPAFATALLGVLAGQWLKSDRTMRQKTLGMIISGLVCIALGYLWSPWFPIIKKLWTSSFTLVAGGWSLLFLASFYYLIDVRGYNKWIPFFVVIGLNPITIYVAQDIIPFDEITAYFVKGALQFTPAVQGILWALSVLAIKWLFLRFLHRQKLYLRV